MERGGEAACWGRSRWAVRWLEQGDMAAAAREVEPGDVLAILAEAFPEFVQALAKQGMGAHYVEGKAFIHSVGRAGRAENSEGRCQDCGVFTDLRIGDVCICSSCYESRGSCCPEFGGDG